MEIQEKPRLDGLEWVSTGTHRVCHFSPFSVFAFTQSPKVRSGGVQKTFYWEQDSLKIKSENIAASPWTIIEVPLEHPQDFASMWKAEEFQHYLVQMAVFCQSIDTIEVLSKGSSVFKITRTLKESSKSIKLKYDKNEEEAGLFALRKSQDIKLHKLNLKIQEDATESDVELTIARTELDVLKDANDPLAYVNSHNIDLIIF